MFSAEFDAFPKISLTLSHFISGPVKEYLYPKNNPTKSNITTGQNANISNKEVIVKEIFIVFSPSLLLKSNFCFLYE